MARFFTSTEKPFNEVDRLGVAICLTDPPRNHCGIIFQLDGEETKLIHLAWHARLKLESPGSEYIWSDVDLDKVNKSVLAAVFANMMRHAGEISYGIDSDMLCFEPDGTYVAPPAGKGLTCATFIVATFLSQGYQIRDVSSWPDREDDVEWQKFIVETMKQYAWISPEHIELVQNDIGAKRLRPDEVVAAASSSLDGWPATFTNAREIADQIVKQLNEMRTEINLPTD